MSAAAAVLVMLTVTTAQDWLDLVNVVAPAILIVVVGLLDRREDE